MAEDKDLPSPSSLGSGNTTYLPDGRRSDKKSWNATLVSRIFDTESRGQISPSRIKKCELSPICNQLSNTATLEWKDISYSVPVGKKRHKTLINSASGCIRPGEMIAVIGGSGAGKTTLMNILAGRIGPGNLTGSITINGHPRDPATWKKVIGYVEQEDILLKNLTVLETLHFAARLRLPISVPAKEKIRKVEHVISELGLGNCLYTQIGGPGKKGVSGGEKKRTAVGIELLNDPKILFLDEPTSGLDAFTALNIIKGIKDAAVSRRQAVMMTVHQPRENLLDLFDKIILMAEGNVLFIGSVEKALAHFSGMGLECPPRTNPGDFFSDMTTIDFRTPDKERKTRMQVEQLRDKWKFIQDASKNSEDKYSRGPQLIIPKRSHHPMTWMAKIWILLERFLLDNYREKVVQLAIFVQRICIIIVFTILYFQISDGPSGVQNRMGFFFSITANQTFSNATPLISVLPAQRNIFRVERAAGAYGASEAFISRFLSLIPQVFFTVTAMCASLYWLVGMDSHFVKFLTFYAVIYSLAITASALGFSIGASAQNLQVAQIFGPTLLVICLLMGGWLVNLDTIPAFFAWVQYVLPVGYATRALAQNEFTGLTFDCEGFSSCIPTGELILKEFALTSPSIWPCIGLLWVLTFLYLGIGYVLFLRTSKPAMRLK